MPSFRALNKFDMLEQSQLAYGRHVSTAKNDSLMLFIYDLECSRFIFKRVSIDKELDITSHLGR